MAKRKDGDNCGGAGDYDVGYGKPPVRTRFKPGKSGNPTGRPKGTNNFKTDVKRTLAASVRVKENGRTRKRTTQQGALMLLREKALQGDVRSLDRLMELASRFNNDAVDSGPAKLGPDDAEILAAYVAERSAGASTVPTSANDDHGEIVVDANSRRTVENE